MRHPEGTRANEQGHYPGYEASRQQSNSTKGLAAGSWQMRLYPPIS